MKQYGANFYLTFTATNDEAARKTADYIASQVSCDGGSHVQEGTVLPLEEVIDGEIVG